MKKLYFLLLSLSVLGFVGCTAGLEGDDNVVVGNGTTTLSLSIADSMTKVGLGDKDETGNYSAFWNEGDQISVNGVASTNITIDSENPGAAVFEFDNANLETPYKNLYPASTNENV
ncbi:MAG: hypothetical protein IKU93_01525, partial [Alistipes sp.]|nr:hypothetical protein [Alistipes sp.]